MIGPAGKTQGQEENNPLKYFREKGEEGRAARGINKEGRKKGKKKS